MIDLSFKSALIIWLFHFLCLFFNFASSKFYFPLKSDQQITVWMNETGFLEMLASLKKPHAIRCRLLCNFMSPVVFNQIDADDLFFLSFKITLMNNEVFDCSVERIKYSDWALALIRSLQLFALLYSHMFWMVVSAFDGYSCSFRSHLCLLFLFFESFLLLVLLLMPVQLERFRNIMNIVYTLLLSQLISFSFSLSFSSLLFRGGSQEKDSAVSSSIVSTVQSKITQVLFFFLLLLLLCQNFTDESINALSGFLCFQHAKKKDAKCCALTQWTFIAFVLARVMLSFSFHPHIPFKPTICLWDVDVSNP